LSKCKILHIGCGSCVLPFDDIEEVRLDVNPNEKPDIVCDITDLENIKAESFDGVWASHVLEHVFEYKVPKVLEGIKHVLKEDGFLFIKVPDLKAVMREIVENDISLSDVLYTSYGNLKVRPIDILYGHKDEVQKLQCLQSHKTGFDSDLLTKTLTEAGFSQVLINEQCWEVRAFAFKTGKIHGWLKKTLNITEEVIV
jgi:SAM-dependent methyltransferase